MASAAMYPEIAALMGDTIEVGAEASTDGYGKRTFNARAGSPYSCYVVFTAKRVWSMEGREETTSLIAYVDADDLQPTDQFTYNGKPYKCLSIETWQNEHAQTIGQVVYLQ